VRRATAQSLALHRPTTHPLLPPSAPVRAPQDIGAPAASHRRRNRLSRWDLSLPLSAGSTKYRLFPRRPRKQVLGPAPPRRRVAVLPREQPAVGTCSCREHIVLAPRSEAPIPLLLLHPLRLAARPKHLLHQWPPQRWYPRNRWADDHGPRQQQALRPSAYVLFPAASLRLFLRPAALAHHVPPPIHLEPRVEAWTPAVRKHPPHSPDCGTRTGTCFRRLCGCGLPPPLSVVSYLLLLPLLSPVQQLPRATQRPLTSSDQDQLLLLCLCLCLSFRRIHW